MQRRNFLKVVTLALLAPKLGLSLLSKVESKTIWNVGIGNVPYIPSSLDVNLWDTRKVTTFYGAFKDCSLCVLNRLSFTY